MSRVWHKFRVLLVFIASSSADNHFGESSNSLLQHCSSPRLFVLMSHSSAVSRKKHNPSHLLLHRGGGRTRVYNM